MSGQGPWAGMTEAMRQAILASAMASADREMQAVRDRLTVLALGRRLRYPEAIDTRSWPT